MTIRRCLRSVAFDKADALTLIAKRRVVKAHKAAISAKENFLAVLQEPLNLGHAVFVEKMIENDKFVIKDPADQTGYKMTRSDFLKNWGGGIVYYEENK